MLEPRFRCIHIGLSVISLLDPKASHCVLTNAWIICDCTRDIEVGLVLLIDHCSADIWDVSPGIALTSNEDFEVLDTKDTLPVLEEADEVLSHLFFRCRSDSASGESCSDRELDPMELLSSTC